MSKVRRLADSRGILAWMVHNRITPNLLMLFLLVGGFFMSTRIKQEVFPEFDLDLVTVSVPYPGASPEEVEQGILLAVEEGIRGLEGIKELTATASEGVGLIRAELMVDADRQQVYQDIRQQVDRITTFPLDAEEPQVRLESRRREVLSIQIYGDVSERNLREVTEQVRDRLLQAPGITQVDVAGGRDFEVQIEISQASLRTFNLNLDEVARRIKAAAVEIPGGSLETASGDLLLRFRDRRDWAAEFGRIPILTTPAGTVLYLEDIGTVREGFADTHRQNFFNGRPSLELEVFRIGEQTPIGVSEAVRQAMPAIAADLPPGVEWEINRDRSDIYQQRLHLLLKNAFIGLLLVLLVLGAFLEFRLAFWVTMGIPISFLGGLLFLPGLGVSINMVSLFAFIVALGIVVDDAIIAGENIYEYRQTMGPIQAAILGARDVAMPIGFSILTNVVAFMPLYFIPGTMGKIWKAIPLVVATVFIISWVESLLILPAHLAHSRRSEGGRWAFLHRGQQRFSQAFSAFVEKRYGPFLEQCLNRRWLTVAAGFALLLVVFGYVFSGRIGMILMPRVEADQAVATAVLPFGSPATSAAAVEERLVGAMEKINTEYERKPVVTGIASRIDENQVVVYAYLPDPDHRPMSTGEVTRQWREAVGSIPGLQTLRFESDRGGFGSGASLTVELSHRDIAILERASAALAERLDRFSNVKDIDDGYTPGKQQLDFRLTTAGQSLGLTATEVARQVRAAFHGVDALRQQRGRNEVRVRVRLPEAQRASEFDVENLMIQTPAGPFVPLLQVAEVSRGRAYTTISRRDARRTVTVTADVVPMGETGQVMATLNRSVLPQLARDFPGLTYGYQGRQAQMKESLQGLLGGFGFSMLTIYFLLAIPFRSYTQPLIVMSAIPFGMVGAVIGHLLMGYNLSLMSMMGMVALSGVVVNDSLVLVDFANRRRREGATAAEAIRAAGLRRFRPVLLTTFTTFGGLAPMIFETSRQARFLIPMALSLGFGIVFATVITLILVPSFYLLLEDLVGRFRRTDQVGESLPAES